MDNYNILAVDDSPDALFIILRMLKKGGYRHLRQADSGELALAAVAAEKPDLILLDIRMTGIDGMEVCRRLKKDENTRDIPIIFITGASDSEERVEGLSAGAVDYVVKPFNSEELLARVKIQLEIHGLKNLLAQEKNKIQSILSSSPVGMLVFNDKQEIIYANAAAEMLFSNKPQLMDRKCCGDFMLCENRRKDARGCGYSKPCATCPIFNGIKEVLSSNAGQIEVDGEIRLHTDGRTSPLYARFKVKSFFIEKQRCALLSIEDITKNKIIEEALRESEMRFMALHNASFGGIAIHDKGVILECNQGLSEITGFAYDELIGMNGLLLISDATRDKVIHNIDTGHEKPYEVEGIRKDGGTYPLRLEARNIRYKDKDVRVVEFRDITERKQAEAARESNYLLLKIAGETAKFGGWSVDLEKNICTWSDAVADIHDLPRGFAPSVQESINFYAPEWREKITRVFSACAEKGIPYDEEMEIITSKGKRVWVRTIGRAMKDENGAIVNVQGSFQDITKRKQDEINLKERERLLQKIFDILPVGLWFADKNGKLLRGNPAGVKIWGAEPCVDPSQYGVFKARRLPSGEEISPDDWALAHTIREGTTTLDELLEIDAFDGRKKIILNFTAPLLDDNGAVQGAVIVNQDITERKRAEEALMERENLFRVIFENAPVSFYIHDPVTGKILDANRNALMSFGLRSLDEFYSGIDLFLPPPYSYSEYVELLHKAAKEEVRRFEWKSQDIEGNIFWEEVFLCPINLNGEKRILQASYNITDRKQADADREKLESQLLQSQKMEAVGQLAGGVAHDFNNMLTVINGYSQMLLSTIAPSDSNYCRVKEIYKAGQRSADLTRQLLAFARKQVIKPEVLDLNDNIDGMLKMLRRLLGENIDLTWKPAASIWKIMMDSSQIDQILANLLVNARDALSGAGKVVIATGNTDLDEAFCMMHPDSIPGKYVVLSVSDNGCGMGKEIIGHIFEPFFTTKKVGEGTGLGLATVFGIVKQNRGFIDVCSEPGKGSTFKIYIPKNKSENQGKDGKPEENRILTGNETVLLVEDEAALLLLAETLLGQLGYTVLAADSPENAIRLASEHKGDIHLLMTDVVMPEMSGRDLLDIISAMRPGIRCLFMSGYTANVIENNGVLDKDVNFLEKPFTAEDLSVKLREALCLQLKK